MIKNKIKSSFKCPSAFKALFKNASCCLTISVGQAHHEGEKLRSTIDAINNAFQSCTIMLCDTLQRHTLAIFSNKPIEILHQESLIAGDMWVKRNTPILERLTIKYDLIRWDYWLGKPNFNLRKAEMTSLYKSDAGFNTALSKTIDEFISRIKHRFPGNEFQHDDIFENCFNYLIEECAAQLLWVDQHYNFEIYPSPRNPILSYGYEKLIEPFHPDLLKPIALKFKNISSV